ncbi:hypothetical protein ACTFIR_009693, partial [Dictyostelium discoideum]
CQMCTGIPFR